MLFEVIQLRRDGKKVPPRELFAPTKGLLVLYRNGKLPDGRPKLTAQLLSERSGYSRGATSMLPPLNLCTITSLDHRGMVIAGRENSDDPATAQAWWCIPVYGEKPTKI